MKCPRCYRYTARPNDSGGLKCGCGYDGPEGLDIIIIDYIQPIKVSNV